MGPVPLPRLTPRTGPTALSWPFMLPLGDPEPRLTALARGPLPVLPLFMPGIPALPRLTLRHGGAGEGLERVGGLSEAHCAGVEVVVGNGGSGGHAEVHLNRSGRRE